MSTPLEEAAKKAQEAMRVADHRLYKIELETDVFNARHEPGVQKVLKLALEMRAKALHSVVSGTKDHFERNQATWLAWASLVQTIEKGPAKNEPHQGEQQ